MIATGEKEEDDEVDEMDEDDSEDGNGLVLPTHCRAQYREYHATIKSWAKGREPPKPPGTEC